ncbi:PIN domain-containing protein [Lysinibacillus sp. UBA5994]|uniref:PIN domain-containing protein n=1 Tax=Lysinibacillus sp. UBA5994 TaxID=1946774 RepID=UPI00258FE6F3|nr:PIN domain-containing protein [Lysinibacillus sp. UBA5994]
MKTYIIFDTNILFNRFYEDFSRFTINSFYDEIQGKIERQDVIDRFELLIPEITIKELFKQQISAFNEDLEQIINSKSKFDNIYEIDINIDETLDYEIYLNEKQDQYIASKGIQLIATCSDNQFSNIVDRALNKKAPFEGKDKKSDKGFKDVLIWESILEHAENNDGEYIFFTADKGFKDELADEFEVRTGKKIEIFGRDDRNKLDRLIEKYSDEKNLRDLFDFIQSSISEVVDVLIDDLNYCLKKDFIKINGMKCKVNGLSLEDKIVDLNEIGDTTYKFGIKGILDAGKKGISYDLKISMYFVVEIVDLKNLHIEKIVLDSIEALTFDDDAVSIEKIKYSFLIKEEEVEEEEEEEEGAAEEEAKHNSIEIPIDEIKIELKRSFLGTHYENDENMLNELCRVIVENYTLDWYKFDSKKAKLRLAIKKFLKLKKITGDEMELIQSTFEIFIGNFHVSYQE